MFLLCLVYFLSLPVVFLYLLWYLFFCSFSWFGGFFVLEGWGGVNLVFLLFATLAFIYLREPRFSIAWLVCLLCVLTLFFISSRGLLVIYIVLELTLFPLLILLLSFGSQPQKVGASLYLIFYGVLSSIPLLWFFISSGLFFSFSFVYLGLISRFLVFLLILGFLMKLPIYFVHSWLPRVHVEAPTSTRVVLAALLLKIGAWGLYCLSPFICVGGFYFFIFLALMSMLLRPLSCLLSSDFKSLAAYSSVVHIGFFFVFCFFFLLLVFLGDFLL